MNRLPKKPGKQLIRGNFRIEICKVTGHAIMYAEGGPCPDIMTRVETPQGNFVVIKTATYDRKPDTWQAFLERTQ